MRTVIIGIVLLLLAAIGARAQTTTITGSLADALGVSGSEALTATCTIAASSTFTAANGAVVTPSAPRLITITGGTLTVALLPVDTATPVGVYYVMTCRVPLQTAAGQVCEGNRTLISGGTCVVGAGESTLYLLVPTSGSPVALKDWYRTAKPRGVTWGDLINAGTTWGQLLYGR